MINTGLLVSQWPLTIGVDACGVVTDLGDKAAELGFKKGDLVCGCTRLGLPNHGTSQELHLRDAQTTMHKPTNLSVPQSVTIGGGFQTAAIAVCEGVKIPMPEKQNEKVGEWVLVCGGAGAVGRATVQLLLLAGYDVVTTCSSRSKDDLTALGATTIDYKQPESHQIDQILKATGGKLSKIIDAAASDNPVVAKEIFKHATGDNMFATTNDWSQVHVDGAKNYEIELGPIGSPDAETLNKNMAKWNAVIVKLFEEGLLSTNQYEVVGEGWDAVIEAFEYYKSGKGGNKRVLVKLQDE